MNGVFKNNEKWLSVHLMRRCWGVVMMIAVVMSVSVADGSAARKDTKQKSVREQIDKKIEKYINDLYEKDIFSDCKRYAEMPTSYDKVRHGFTINAKFETAVDDVMAYGEKLADQFPSEASYARQQASVLVNAKQTQAMMMAYPDNGESDDGVKLDNDSILSIYKEFQKKQ